MLSTGSLSFASLFWLVTILMGLPTTSTDDWIMTSLALKLSNSELTSLFTWHCSYRSTKGSLSSSMNCNDTPGMEVCLSSDLWLFMSDESSMSSCNAMLTSGVIVSDETRVTSEIEEMIFLEVISSLMQLCWTLSSMICLTSSSSCLSPTLFMTSLTLFMNTNPLDSSWAPSPWHDLSFMKNSRKGSTSVGETRAIFSFNWLCRFARCTFWGKLMPRWVGEALFWRLRGKSRSGEGLRLLFELLLSFGFEDSSRLLLGEKLLDEEAETELK